MKKVLTYTAILAALFSMISCVVDVKEQDTPVKESEMAVIYLKAPKANSTRAGEDADNRIDFFRLLMFNSKTGKLAYNKYYDMTSTENPITLEVILGTYHFVFVVNEHIDTRLHNILAALDGSASIQDVDAQYFSSSCFTNDGVIPGAGMVNNVSVEKNKKVVVEGVTTSGTWDISKYIDRLGIRVDLQLTSTRPWHWNALNEVRISRLPNKVYLLEKRFSGSMLYNDSAYETNYRKILPGDFERTNLPNQYVGKLERVILPSSVFADKNNPNKAILFQVDLEGSPLRGATLGINEPTNYTAPANRYFRFHGTFDNDVINFKLQVIDWKYFETDM